MVATDTGKIGIIRRSRESGAPIRSRYKDARTAIRSALCDPVAEKRILAATKNALEQRSEDPSQSDFARDDAEKSFEALAAFADIRNQLAGYDYAPAPKSQPKLILNGVEVSVQIDVLIHRSYRGAEQVGAALFRLTKPEDDETDKAADKRRDVGQYTLCWSVDVQNGEVHAAPRNYLTRATNLENACRFIRAMWDTA